MDPFDEMRRAIRRMRDFIREFEDEIESAMERDLERLSEEKWSELSSDVREPLHTVIDKGDKVLIIVEVPEAEEESIQVTILEDAIVVEGKVDKQKMERIAGGRRQARMATRVKGVYKLPYALIPEDARVERKGGKIYIWVPKKGKAWEKA